MNNPNTHIDHWEVQIENGYYDDDLRGAYHVLFDQRNQLLAACKYVAGRLQDGDCEYDDVASMVLNLQAAIATAEESHE